MDEIKLAIQHVKDQIAVHQQKIKDLEQSLEDIKVACGNFGHDLTPARDRYMLNYRGEILTEIFICKVCNAKVRVDRNLPTSQN
jgi:archaellum component FlaC